VTERTWFDGDLPAVATDRLAVLVGGAAGSFLSPDDLDVPLTFEGTRAAGTSLGSGVVLVLDDTVDLGRLLMRIAAFFRDESCGQCVPCRVGTVRCWALTISGRLFCFPGWLLCFRAGSASLVGLSASGRLSERGTTWPTW
jgi:hypothetical protein